MSQQDWQIKAPAAACTACGRPFDDGEAFTSALDLVEAEGYLRSDRCADCWDESRREGAVSVWRSVFRPPPPPRPEPLPKETAESLLRRLMEAGDPARRDAVFVLAVMLERKRMLIEREVQVQPGGEETIRVYEHRGTGETFVVTDPHLRLDDLERVQREVVLLLGGAAADPEATPAAESAAPPAGGHA